MRTTALSAVTFSKYQGLGNDFILVDARESEELPMSATQAQELCDRNFGVGADGVIFVLPAEEDHNHYKMRIINSDASEPEMCGNGIRCMAQYLVQELDAPGEKFDDGSQVYRIETGAGVIVPSVLADGTRVAVDMGEPILQAKEIPTTLEPNAPDDAVIESDLEGEDFKVTCVSMGNPHAIAFVDDVDAIDLRTVGPRCENHPAFPSRINTEFVQVIDRTTLKMRVWERGAGATLACGTGACAVAVAAVLTDRADQQCTVQLPGGDLEIDWRDFDNRIIMTGPAELVFTGAYPLASESSSD